MNIKFGTTLENSVDITTLFINNFVIIPDNVVFIKKKTSLIKILGDPNPLEVKTIWIIKDNQVIFNFTETDLISFDITFDLSTINNKIDENPIYHIVLCYYNRFYNLEKQIKMINDQTVANNIHLHIINNNTELKEIFHKKITTYQNDDQINFTIHLSHYDNTYNCYQRFIYIRDVLLPEYSPEYVMIIDDDMIFITTWVEKLWALKQKRTVYGWYGKIWNNWCYNYWEDSIIGLEDCHKQNKKHLNTFDYIGPGGTIMATEIFRSTCSLFRLPNDLPDNLNLYNMDDIWLSYILSKENWNILRSYLPPTTIKTKNYDTSLSKGLRKQKKMCMNYLLISKRWLQ